MLHDIRWTLQKIFQRLRLIESLVYRRRFPINPFSLQALQGDQDNFMVGESGESWRIVEPNSYWLGPGINFILKTNFQVPSDWNQGSPIALFLPLGEAGDFSHPEALAYIDGTPYAACDRHHQEIILPAALNDGQTHELRLIGWSGGTQRLRFDGDSGAKQRLQSEHLMMGACSLVDIDQPTRDFAALARVALGFAEALEKENPIRSFLLNALDDAFKILDTREPFGDRFYGSIEDAQAVLQDGINRSGDALPVDITAVGHAHIDVAWLWTLGQTRQKAGRTFHNVLRLMERFPNYKFTQSQPQLYDYVRQDFPELFASIKERISSGEWEAIGGMWVEADCNLSGAESLARQFLIGRQFFRDHFGEDAESPVLWLPDVFGYAWNLPQLIKEVGLEYFFTIKIGWSQYNRLPYDSFWWQGLDGTKVLTHFSPTKEYGSAFASTYNAKATPEQVLSTWTNFQQKDAGEPGITPPLLMAFGHGDGGGGPTHEMLENIKLMGSFPGSPRVKNGKVIDFFRDLEEKVGDQLPTWNGELYLEYHRGTYTTQARNKRANRKCEFLLHDAEFVAAYAATIDESYQYPQGELKRAWELLCLNQFHDIIPGSSIGPVYVESLQQYAEIVRIAEGIRDDALTATAQAKKETALLINPIPFSFRPLLFLPEEQADGIVQPELNQKVVGGRLLDVGELSPYAILPYREEDYKNKEIGSLQVSSTLLENDFIRVELNANGEVIRLYDRRQDREILAPGEVGNQLQLFEDRPKTPDAWEIDIYYDDRIWFAGPAESIIVVENGPLRATIEVVHQIFNSTIKQRISLSHASARLDFTTDVMWHERHMMLKVAFPVDILSPVATYEIQWGNVQRPTHRNTSWDWARFETCAQKWVDLSEGDYGVSLLNDCKYGHDIRDNVLRLTLLRGPTDPDPQADLGKHTFTYSILPHAGPLSELTFSEAYALNDPPFLYIADNARKPAGIQEESGLGSFITVDQANMIMETIKRAEDGVGIIVRMYESKRQRGQCIVKAGFQLKEAWLTNILEENGENLVVVDQQVRVPYRPYQIITLRLIPAS